MLAANIAGYMGAWPGGMATLGSWGGRGTSAMPSPPSEPGVRSAVGAGGGGDCIEAGFQSRASGLNLDFNVDGAGAGAAAAGADAAAAGTGVGLAGFVGDPAGVTVTRTPIAVNLAESPVVDAGVTAAATTATVGFGVAGVPGAAAVAELRGATSEVEAAACWRACATSCKPAAACRT